MKRFGHCTSNGRCGGWTMLVVVFISFVAIAMASVMLTTSLATSREAALSRNGVESRYLADAAMEVAANIVGDQVSASLEPSDGSVDVGGTTINYTVQRTGFEATDTDASGITSILTGYEVTARSEVRFFRAASSRIVNIRRTPLFQYAVFYNGTLEIQPGPEMTIRGRIHTNGDLHLGAGNKLTLDTNYLRVAGKLYGHRKDNVSSSDGDIQIRRWVEDPFNPAEPVEYFRLNTKDYMDPLVPGTSGGYDSDFVAGHDDNGDGDFTDTNDWLPWALGALEYWKEPTMYLGGSGHTVMTDVHGVPPAEPPPIESIIAYEPLPEGTGGDWDWSAGTQEWVPSAPGSGTHKKGAMNDQAGLSFIVNPDGTWTATDESGLDVSSAVAGAVTIDDIYDTRQAAGSSSKNPVFKIDMEQLNASGRFPSNGLLYAAWSTSGQGTNARGIQLVNGSELQGPLTVVTENQLYVQGDYNTVNKKPAGVISDAVNLLSNAWKGSKNSHNGDPKATSTQFNAAIVTGGPESTVGNYSGGFENLPRFHENWDGVDCRILGSFVKLWPCQYATGDWADAGYRPPNRLWQYDEDFNDVTKLPPFTPVEVSSVDVVSWYE